MIFTEANEKEAEKVSGQLQSVGLSSGGADGATAGKPFFPLVMNIVLCVYLCLSWIFIVYKFQGKRLPLREKKLNAFLVEK